MLKTEVDKLKPDYCIMFANVKISRHLFMYRIKRFFCNNIELWIILNEKSHRERSAVSGINGVYF
jgi:hypothetical protein